MTTGSATRGTGATKRGVRRPGEYLGWLDTDEERVAWVLEHDATPAFLAAVDDLRRMYGAGMTDAIRRHHAIGQYVKRIKDDPAYGINVVKNLELVLGWAAETLNLDLHLAGAFTDDEVDAFCRLRMADGRPLGYRHLTYLAAVPADRRPAVLNRVLAGSWTVVELARFLAAEHERAVGKSARGRPLKAPRDFAGVLAQQAGYARDFAERNARVWATDDHSLSAKAVLLGQDQVTAERVEQVRQLAADLRVVAAEAAKRADEADAVHRRLAGILALTAGPARRLTVEDSPARERNAGGESNLTPAVLPPFVTRPCGSPGGGPDDEAAAATGGVEMAGDDGGPDRSSVPDGAEPSLAP